MTDPTPLDGVDVVLADLDGVIYQGPHAIPHAVESMNRVAEKIRVGYITNNASRTAATVADQLTGFGLTVAPDDVVTSPQAAIKVLATLVPAGSKILVVGGDGLTDVVEKAGFAVVRAAAEQPAAVIQGFAPSVGWNDLKEASFAVASGIPWVATNTDWTIPVEGGIAPGNGTLVSAVHTATGILPTVAGKPEPAIFDAAVERFGSTSPLFIGDRLDTDILGANRANITSLLVLTGIDGPKQLLAAAPDSRPHFVVEDLRGLFEPYPVISQGTDAQGAVVTSVGGALVRRLEEKITVLEPGSRIDLIRAGAAAVWTSGMAIYALDVAPELYS